MSTYDAHVPRRSALLLCALLWLTSSCVGGEDSGYDPVVIHLVVVSLATTDVANNNTGASSLFELRHSQLMSAEGWRRSVGDFASVHRHGIEATAQLETHVEATLLRYGYPTSLVFNNDTYAAESHITSHDAATRLLMASSQAGDWLSAPSERFYMMSAGGDGFNADHQPGPFQPTFFLRSRARDAGQFINSLALARDILDDEGLTVSPSVSQMDKLTVSLDIATPYPSPHQFSRRDKRTSPSSSSSSSSSFSPSTSTSFIIYQNVGANTGGTTALRILHEQLLQLGFPSLLCGDDNRLLEPKCASPPVSAILVTGEWCHEVLRDYRVGRWRGRAVQYHLGFHHHDVCRGHVALASSHYLTALLGGRVMGGYFLGAPLTGTFKTSVARLLHQAAVRAKTDKSFFEAPAGGGAGADLEELSDLRKMAVLKENLIVMDMDLLTDYSPEEGVPFEIPSGYRVVKARDIRAEEMPLILQRAKLLVDLAMPGPERLSTEAILMGAIPLISNRWNGASDVDFPGVVRVDQQNSSSLTLAIAHVLSNYDAMLDSVDGGRFFAHALSLWDRARQTTQVLASAASVHFVLVARTLREEGQAVLRLLALIYLYPLATFDVYVVDATWFVRHHYAALRLLKAGGYMRRDIMDPKDDNRTTTFYPTAKAARGAGEESEEEDVEGGEESDWGGASLVRIKRLEFLRACTERNPGIESGVNGRVSRDPASCRLVPPWAEAVVSFFPSTSALMFTEPNILLDVLSVLKQTGVDNGGEGGVVRLVVPPAGGEGPMPLAAVMTATLALRLHSCDPPPEGEQATMLYDFLFRHELFSHIVGVPFQELSVDSHALMDLDIEETSSTPSPPPPPSPPSRERFLRGLLSSPAWLALGQYYSETRES